MRPRAFLLAASAAFVITLAALSVEFVEVVRPLDLTSGVLQPERIRGLPKIACPCLVRPPTMTGKIADRFDGVNEFLRWREAEWWARTSIVLFGWVVGMGMLLLGWRYLP